MKSNITKYAVIFYILTVVLLYIYRPSFIYNNLTNKFKEFGFTDDKTILCLPVLALISAIIIYIIFSILLPKESIEDDLYKKILQISKAPIVLNYQPSNL